MSTIPQLQEWKRRKHEIEMHIARYGSNTSPEWKIEGQDLETVIHNAERIDIHRNRLRVLLQQRTHFGENVSPHVQMEIDSARKEIINLRALCKNRGYSIAAHEVDNDPVEVSTPPIIVQEERLSDRLARIEQKLDCILSLLGGQL